MKIPKPEIVPQTVEVLYPDGSSMGFLNEYELNEVRLQINKNHLEGYSVKFQDQIIPIDKNGWLQSWPSGFFDLIEKQLSQLISW